MTAPALALAALCLAASAASAEEPNPHEQLGEAAKCGVVPYRPCTDEESAERESRPVQGPPKREAFDNGEVKGHLLRFPDGRVSYCEDEACSNSGEPMTPEQAKRYLSDKANEQGNKKQWPGAENRKETQAGAPGGRAEPPPSSVENGYRDGNDPDLVLMKGTGDSSETSDRPSDAPRPRDEPRNSPDVTYVNGDRQKELNDKQPFTWWQTQKIDAQNKQEAKNFLSGKSGFAVPGETPDPHRDVPDGDVNPTKVLANDGR